jgi:hypothetical protein
MATPFITGAPPEDETPEDEEPLVVWGVAEEEEAVAGDEETVALALAAIRQCFEWCRR